MTTWIEERYIKPNVLEKRSYQVNIAETATEQSTLVVLPTGMGKTVIAVMLIARRIDKGNVLFLAPTKPLALQHYEFLRENLTIDLDDILLFTGEMSPKKRKALWPEKRIIVSTPQVVQNDIISGVKSLGDISLIIFDEAHRAVGNYSYVFIGEKYAQDRDRGLVLAITASPGSDPGRIREVCDNLSIEHFEIRSKWDGDVRPYVHEIKMSWIEVDLPENIKRIKKYLDDILDSKIDSLRKMKLIWTRKVSVTKLLELQKIILGRLHAEGKSAPKYLYQAMSLQAQAMKINHALELLTTQGMEVLNNYFDKLKAEGRSKGASAASRSLLNEPKFKYAMSLSKIGEKVHPKIPKVREIVKVQLLAKEDSRIILFTQFRGSANTLVEELDSIPGARPEKFVGQRSTETDKGLKQKEQFEVIKRFREGVINVLIATSVAEEGLDIPSTDLVIFYEPIPSEIRTIQRRGRTGRTRAGKVIILMAKGTRDEAYYWTSRHKEKRMRKEIEVLKRDFAGGFLSPSRRDKNHEGSSGQKKDYFGSEEEEEKLVIIRQEEVRSSETPSETGSEPEEVKSSKTPSEKSSEPKEVISSETPSEKDSEPKEVISSETPSEKDSEPEEVRSSEIPSEMDSEPEEVKSSEIQSETGSEPEEVIPSETLPGTHSELPDLHTYHGVMVPSFPPGSANDQTVDPGKDRLGDPGPDKPSGQTSLGDFQDEGGRLIVVVDTREFNSEVVKHLSRMNVIVKSKQLEVGDYILSDRAAVERKEVSDFLTSMMDGHLFNQLRKLKVYQNPILIIEGDGLFTTRNISEEAIFGALSAIVMGLGINIIMCKDSLETARFLVAGSKREANKGRIIKLRGDKTSMALRERQQYILEGLPNISAKLAQRLLTHFRSVKAVMNASEEELREVRGIGDMLAKAIREAIDAEYGL